MVTFPFPSTGSTIDLAGHNTTQTAVSTNILISVGPNPVGAIQDITITETRPLKMIDEVGTDGHIDSVPNMSTNIKGTCKRVRYDRMRISEAFSRGYVHAHSQRYPFDITIIDGWNGNPLNLSDTSQDIITTIKNVWIAEISFTYQTSDWVIVDNMSFEAESISSTLGSSSTPAAQGGTRSIPLALLSPTSDIERAADVGQLRGGLGVVGLISAFLPF
jgi:hypothetical protein